MRRLNLVCMDMDSPCLFWQSECNHRLPGGDGHELLVIERVRHGEAFHFSLVWNCHSGLPVSPSTAISLPLSSPTNTKPVEVASVPPQESPAPICDFLIRGVSL